MVLSALVLGLTTACSDGATSDSKGDTDSTGDTESATTDVLALDPDSEPLQHLIVVSVDTLRWDAVSWNGAAADTPFLDSLAAQALVLEDHRSCASWTLPSMLCYFSGQDGVDLGYEPVPLFGILSGIPADFKGLTGWLKDAGWRTVLVPTNALVSDSVPIGNDFDSVLLPLKADDPGSATGVVDTARSWMLEHPWSSDGPSTYLHLHLLDPHDAYAPPEGYEIPVPDLPIPLSDLDDLRVLSRTLPDLSPNDQRAVVSYLRDLYTAETRYMDDELARLWDMLEESGWLTNSLVLFMADHGEGFWEHQTLLHGNSLYRDVAAVPAFLMAPGLKTGTWTGATTHKDLAPTLLTMLGLDIPAEVTGEVVGQAPENRVRLSLQVGEILDPRISGDSGGKILHYSWGGERALYDVTTDPGELTDVYDDHPEEVAAIWEVLEDAVLSVSSWPDGTVPVDPGP